MFPHYDPPYDSPLEDLFAHNISKYLGTNVVLNKQVDVETICGTFRVDFVADCGPKIAFECDGAEYHDAARDEWRDAMILGADAVDVIYRLRGRDLTYHLEDCLFVISRLEPDIFSHRGLLHLGNLATQEARTFIPGRGTWHSVTYKPARPEMDPLVISITRNSRIVPKGQRSFWKSVFRFAREKGGGDMDSLIAEWRRLNGMDSE